MTAPDDPTDNQANGRPGDAAEPTRPVADGVAEITEDVETGDRAGAADVSDDSAEHSAPQAPPPEDPSEQIPSGEAAADASPPVQDSPAAASGDPAPSGSNSAGSNSAGSNSAGSGPGEFVPSSPAAGSAANGSATGVTSGFSYWQSTGTAASDAGTTAGDLQVPQPDQSRNVNQPKADPRTAAPAYGHSAGLVPASGAGPRYGRPVVQPFNSPPRRAPSQFSQPTVRIGGRVQPEQAPPHSPGARVRPTRIPRRASLQLRYLEPWSVLKVSLVLSVAGFLAWMVAVGVLYSILGGMGVWDQLNGTYSDLTSVNDPQAGDDLISAGGVFGVAALVGLVNIVLITAMCTVGAFIYNASADLAGGIEVTLSERD